MGPWFFGVDGRGEDAAAAVAVLFVIVDHVFECDVLAASNDCTPEHEICNLRVASDCSAATESYATHPISQFNFRLCYVPLSWPILGFLRFGAACVC